MIAVLLFGLIASAWAAPQYDFSLHETPSYFPAYRSRADLNGENLFDTGRFWADISKELREIDDMLADFTHRFSASTSQEGIQGNEYKITIPLSGFEEKDIIVKARAGLLMIQANHKFAEGSERNYLDVRTLPASVNVTGTWTFENSVLKIVFPMKDGVEAVETVTVVSTDITTVRPIFDREEIDESHVDETEVKNADVGLDRHVGKETELLTNEIPGKRTIEATTYAVDLKDEVEFVPVRF